MNFTVDDPTLAREVQRVIDEFNQKRDEADRIAAMSYQERLDGFLGALFEVSGLLIGSRDWYKDLPCFATFPPPCLAKYFKKGEPVPCVMRGSLHVMRGRSQPKHSLACEVLMRFIRRKRLTCTSKDEWHALCASPDGLKVINRIDKKWNSSSKPHFRDFALFGIVSKDDHTGGADVLIDGRVEYFSAEKRLLLDVLGKHEAKLKRLESAYRKIASI